MLSQPISRRNVTTQSSQQPPRFLNYHTLGHVKDSQSVSYTVRVLKWTMALLPGTGTSYPIRLFLPAMFGHYGKIAAGTERTLSTRQIYHQRLSLLHTICFPRLGPSLRCHTLFVPLISSVCSCFRLFARSRLTTHFRSTQISSHIHLANDNSPL